MGENSAIEWTDHTFNPWWGCTKVGPGCDHCYAETLARRFGVKWGAGEPRRTFGARHWDEPLKWNARAEREGLRRRVFCASMADVFDNDAPASARDWLWEVIEETTSLDWLLLTKRIGNAANMFPQRWRLKMPPNIWLGATVVNQEEADRDIPKLLSVAAAVRFLSCEPLLGSIRLLRGHHLGGFPKLNVHWIIVGGESGQLARPFVLGWAKELVRDCAAAGIAVFVKQIGAKPTNREGEAHAISDRKGSVMADWPQELRVREFPRCAA